MGIVGFRDREFHDDRSPESWNRSDLKNFFLVNQQIAIDIIWLRVMLTITLAGERAHVRKNTTPRGVVRRNEQLINIPIMGTMPSDC